MLESLDLMEDINTKTEKLHDEVRFLRDKYQTLVQQFHNGGRVDEAFHDATSASARTEYNN